jgi:hypothetical protein
VCVWADQIEAVNAVCQIVGDHSIPMLAPCDANDLLQTDGLYAFLNEHGVIL